MRKELFTLVYFTMGIIFILVHYLEYEIIKYISKPLIMPILLFGYLSLANKFSVKKNTLFIFALIFSWLGDSFLLLQEFSFNFFLVGLVSFLVAHLFYIWLFYKPIIWKPLSALKITLFIIFTLYTVLFLWFLIPHLNAFKIPVIIYAIIIILMLLTALNQQGKIDKEAFQYIFGGAFLFVVSDSLIAINKFHIPFSLSTLSIMSFYLFAQYFIMKGIIIRDQNTNNQ